jgi:hypothetical protein
MLGCSFYDAAELLTVYFKVSEGYLAERMPKNLPAYHSLIDNIKNS